MPYIECITSDPAWLDNKVAEFCEKNQRRYKTPIETRLNTYFGKHDIYGRAWYRMYEEFQKGYSVLSDDQQLGYSTFYRGVAASWKIRQSLVNGKFYTQMLENEEWVEVEKSLDASQMLQVQSYFQEHMDYPDAAYRRSVAYLHRTQINSLQVLYHDEGLTLEQMIPTLMEFQHGMDIGLMRWRNLSTIG